MVPNPTRKAFKPTDTLGGELPLPVCTSLDTDPRTEPEVLNPVRVGNSGVAVSLGVLLKQPERSLPTVYVRVPRPPWNFFKAALPLRVNGSVGERNARVRSSLDNTSSRGIAQLHRKCLCYRQFRRHLRFSVRGAGERNACRVVVGTGCRNLRGCIFQLSRPWRVGHRWTLLFIPSEWAVDGTLPCLPCRSPPNHPCPNVPRHVNGTGVLSPAPLLAQ